MTFPLELTALMPLWVVTAGAVVLLLLEMFTQENGRKILPIVAVSFVLLALGSDFSLLAKPGMPGALFN
ncbi:MAG TPA: hypothetical protein VK791_00485, partial [bacterium]|nr:hypothetical protein [bacterium]